MHTSLRLAGGGLALLAPLTSALAHGGHGVGHLAAGAPHLHLSGAVVPLAGLFTVLLVGIGAAALVMLARSRRRRAHGRRRAR